MHGKEADQEGVKEVLVALAEGKICRVQLRNYTKQHSLFSNELSISPVKGENGKITHFIGVQKDITDIRNFE